MSSCTYETDTDGINIRQRCSIYQVTEVDVVLWVFYIHFVLNCECFCAFTKFFERNIESDISGFLYVVTGLCVVVAISGECVLPVVACKAFTEVRPRNERGVTTRDFSNLDLVRHNVLRRCSYGYTVHTWLTYNDAREGSKVRCLACGLVGKHNIGRVTGYVIDCDGLDSVECKGYPICDVEDDNARTTGCGGATTTTCVFMTGNTRGFVRVVVTVSTTTLTWDTRVRLSRTDTVISIR